MARSAKHVHKVHSVTLFPKFLRFFCLGRRYIRSSSYVRRGVLRSANRKISEFILNSDIDGKTSDKEAFDVKKQVPFVAPRLDKSRLIIKELKMGSVYYHHVKAKLGSKVSVKCEYKSEGGESIEKVTHILVLGISKQMRELHDGICGMSIGDKRRLHIPCSLQSD